MEPDPIGGRHGLRHGQASLSEINPKLTNTSGKIDEASYNHVRKKDIDRAVKTMKGALKSTYRQLKVLRQSENETTEELAALKETMTVLEASCDSHGSQKAELSSEVIELQCRFNNLTAQFQESQKKVTACEWTAAELRQQMQTLTEQITRERTEKDELKEGKKKLKKQFHILNHEKSKADARCHEKETETGKMMEEVDMEQEKADVLVSEKNAAAEEFKLLKIALLKLQYISAAKVYREAKAEAAQSAEEAKENGDRVLQLEDEIKRLQGVAKEESPNKKAQLQAKILDLKTLSATEMKEKQVLNVELKGLEDQILDEKTAKEEADKKTAAKTEEVQQVKKQIQERVEKAASTKAAPAP